MGTDREVVIIGAGVGGLAAANALYRTGWRVTVLERADALRPIGAGIAVPPNAMYALDAVDADGMTLGARVRAVGDASGGAIGARRPDGRWIFRPSGDPVGRRFGYPVYSLVRTELLATFAVQLPADTIRFQTEALTIDPGSADRPARVETAGGRAYEADLVVAADGGRSAARRVLFPDHPDPADGGYTIWWMLAPGLDDGEEVIASEAMGKGAVWGTWPLNDGRIYAYATVLKRIRDGVENGERASERAGVGDPLSELRVYFSDWYPQIRRILDAVDPASVYRDDARWMRTPLPAYHVGRVALLGDAAHPMTPDLGQGGSQSIEDAVVLARLLAEVGSGPLSGALAAYTAARLPRTMGMVKRSKRMATFHHASTPLGMALRDQALKLSSSERTVGLAPAHLRSRVRLEALTTVG
ncbi:MAG TPA: FAD-dependent monooxygenase [Actinocrinis sp.]|uniref:FAD-dependent oxidoreductase n=1 Tax=Actinocrinis sp. TaxID=1920516 RepID=UPI002DDDA862|nr:FAD-dependent monooxygenase [Actinocrinis sp.]HEV2346128.1 FAD-dependent monooxygenase [Actinocrinis sp.]